MVSSNHSVSGIGQTPKLLHKRSDLHLARKGFHMSGGLILLFLYLGLDYSRETMAAILGTALTMIMTLEFLRARFTWVNTAAVKLGGPIMRDTEVNQVSGIPFYISSCLFAFLVYPRHISVLSILFLAFGDPCSSFFGVLYGRNKIFPNKSLQGTLGGLFVCGFAAFLYLFSQGIDSQKILVLSMLGGIAGSFAELLPLNIDDNFSIPVVSGALMWLAFWCAQIPAF